MKFLIQRVLKSEVKATDQILGSIGKGLLVLISITENDTKITADKMIQKLLNLRIFEDEKGKTNLDLGSVDGELLLVSQFTLCADCRKGNRPSFSNAAKPELAKELYYYIIERCRESVQTVREGEFGAEMQVSLINDGPFTVMLDSDQLNI